MRDNLPEMLRTAAKEWREENKFIGIGETRYDVALEEAANAIEEFAIIQEGGKGYILAPQEEYDGLKRKYVVLKSDTGEIVENCTRTRSRSPRFSHMPMLPTIKCWQKTSERGFLLSRQRRASDG